MRFCFIDRVEKIDAGAGITASKGVSYAEPYLADHFPGAPVMPGAMMIEAAIEAATWFLRQERGFPLEDYLVEEVRQGKFSKVVRPGDVLTLSVTYDKKQDNPAVIRFKARGTSETDKVFSARFSLRPQPYVQGSLATARQEAVLQKQKELWSVLSAQVAE